MKNIRQGFHISNMFNTANILISVSAPTGEVGELDQPTNLLATFIEYASIITHDVRGT